MVFLNKINKLLKFDVPYSEFELIETESGEPNIIEQQQNYRKNYEHNNSFLSNKIENNLERIRIDFRADINKDLIIRKIKFENFIDCAVVSMTGMSDSKIISDFIIKPMLEYNKKTIDIANITDILLYEVVAINESEKEKSISSIKDAISDGKCVVIIDGSDTALIFETRGYEHRSVGKPDNEKTIKGSQEAFVESLRTNITLIRRIVRTNDLICEFRPTGGENKTKMAILYRDEFTNKNLLNEVKKRLNKIDGEIIENSGIIEQLIEGKPNSLAPQILSTERPDRTASFIMKGHIAVIIEGSPFALVMPITLFTLMASGEDMSMREPIGTLVRIIRYIGVIISIMLPGMFLALALYHPGLLTTQVLSTVISARKMVFLPLGVELILLSSVFQLIREAGMRVPGQIGQAIGIIGGLILGQAAVAANLVSSVVLIIVAITGLGNFAIPDYSLQVASSYIRLALIIAAWVGGLLGISIVLVISVAYFSSVKSFGVPFLAPIAPKTNESFGVIFRKQVAPMKKKDYVNTEEKQ